MSEPSMDRDDVAEIEVLEAEIEKLRSRIDRAVPLLEQCSSWDSKFLTTALDILEGTMDEKHD